MDDGSIKSALRAWARGSYTQPKRKTLAVDMDDVLVDFTGGVRAEVLRDTGIHVEPFTSWEIRDVLDPILGRSWWSWMKERSHIWADFDPIDDAILTLSQLRADGWQIEIVTSKPRWAEMNVWRWIAKHGPAATKVTIVGDKDSKADASSAAILVDDKPLNIEQWVASGRHGILFERSHNEGHATDHPRIHRANGWSEVRALLEAM